MRPRCLIRLLVEVFVFSSVGVRFEGSDCPVIVLSQGSAPHPAKEG